MKPSVVKHSSLMSALYCILPALLAVTLSCGGGSLSTLHKALNKKSQAAGEEQLQNLVVKAGESIDVPVYGGGSVQLTAADSDGDGLADSLSLGGKVEFTLIHETLAAPVTGLDTNNDGKTDYYLHQNSSGSFHLINKAGQLILPVLDNNGRLSAFTREGEVLFSDDTEKPVVFFVKPEDGGQAAGTITIDVSAVDNNGIDRVEFYVDGKFLAHDPAAPYRAQWDSTAVADGEHTLLALAVDLTGNRSRVEQTVTVYNDKVATDVTPPEVELISPLNNSYVNGGVVLEANAADTVAMAAVEFYINGLLVNRDEEPPYSYTFNSTAHADGSYAVKAVAYDAASNQAVDNDTVIFVHNTPPLVSASSLPAAGSNNEVGGEVTIAAAASSDLAGALRADFYHNGTVTGSDNTEPYSFTWNAMLEEQGSVHHWEVRVYDALGNYAADSLTLNVDNNNLGPAPTAHAGSDLVVQSGAPAVLNGSLSSDSDGYIIAYEWTETDGKVAPLTGQQPSFTAPAGVQSLTFELRVRDNFNNVSNLDRVNVLIVKDLSRAVFVDALAPGGGDGSIDLPYNLISTALSYAGAGKDFYIKSSAVYDESGAALLIPADTGLYGGFDQNWVRDVSANRTVVNGASTAVNIAGISEGTLFLSGLAIEAAVSPDPSTAVIGVRVYWTQAPLFIEDVSILNGDVSSGSSDSAASNYGLYTVFSSPVTVTNSTITAGRGGDGSAGEAGQTGAAGQGGSDGVIGTSGGSAGGEGGAGGDGADSSLGPNAVGSGGGNGGRGGYAGYSSSCDGDVEGDGYTGYGGPGTANKCKGGKGGDTSPACGTNAGYGSAGGSGVNGSAGTAGQLPDVEGYGIISADLFTPVNGHNGTNGNGGTGGKGGGGGGGYYGWCADDRGGGGGGGGGGGAGGAGGLGGHGAGGSFAVFSINTELTVTASTLTAGAGGTGGDGGAGGAGGSGGNGGNNGAGPDDGGPGGDGGDGGDGGRGGDGSGGNGGPSIAVLYWFKAPVFTGGLSTVTHGSGGAGGSAGGYTGQEALLFDWVSKEASAPVP